MRHDKKYGVFIEECWYQHFEPPPKKPTATFENYADAVACAQEYIRRNLDEWDEAPMYLMEDVWIRPEPDGVHFSDQAYADILRKQRKGKTPAPSASDDKSAAESLVKSRIPGFRKGTTDVPNWTHSFNVRDVLQRHGYTDEVVLAGLLHDIVEDGNTTLDDLRNMGYSPRVVELVDLCSHDPTVEGGEARWVKMVARLVEANNADAWAIKVADITDNIRGCVTMPIERQVFMRQVKGALMLRLSKAMLKENALWKELSVEVGNKG
jgi:hypothetical protein